MDSPTALLALLGVTLLWVRALILGTVLLLTPLAALAWAARSRRLPPFGRLARGVRALTDPALGALERRLWHLRIRHRSANLPWWGLATVLLGGVALVMGLDLLREILRGALLATRAGGAGVPTLLVRWTIGLLHLAIFLRVVTSWFGGGASAIGRLAHRLTEWFLGPLRRALPPVGLADLSPIVAWFLLILVERLLLALV
ncbi:MAG: YggT family protein [Gemmatimonadaceae bacterium]